MTESLAKMIVPRIAIETSSLLSKKKKNLLAALDTEPDVAVVIIDDDEGLEASSLIGTSLFLNGQDLHDLVLETKVELVHDLVLLDC